MIEQLTHPIVLAPMASGATTPALVAAVSEAGGLGCLGCAMHSPEAMERDVAEIRLLTAKPFAVNLFILDELTTPDPAQVMAAWEVLRPIRAELGLPDVPPPAKFGESFRAQFERLVALRVPIASFTFGILTPGQMDALHGAGSYVIGTATTVEEAVAWERLGADAVCAQGSEAGGHRSTFLHDFSLGLIGLMALLPQVVDAVRCPVLGAGGIGDGRGVAAALALGATAAQIGTTFLRASECGISQTWKDALGRAKETDTRVSRIYTGRPARGLDSELRRRLEPFAQTLPPYPVQLGLTAEIRAAAAKQGRAEFLSAWAGQAVALSREEPAADIMRRLVAETRAAAGTMSARV